jgi:hypothetical protein
MWQGTALLLAIAGLVFACGGSSQSLEPLQHPEVADAEQAIEIVRRSFNSMGGLDRLRLTGTKAVIQANASAQGRMSAIRITLGGPYRWRFDYLVDEISYIYEDGKCRREIYGIPTHCTPAEEQWIPVTRLFVGLIFPAGDAAKLNATFKLRDPDTIDGKSCQVIEIRPKETNLRFRAAYAEESGLLVQAKFSTRDKAGARVHWRLELDDWRTVNKMQIPFKKRLAREGEVVWQEQIEEIDFAAFDEWAFRAPQLPAMDQPHIGSLPPRRVVKSKINGVRVELPAPPPALGGGPDSVESDASFIPPSEVLRQLHRGTIAEIAGMSEIVKGSVLAAGRQAQGEMAIILLEESLTSDSPALSLIYQPLAPTE